MSIVTEPQSKTEVLETGSRLERPQPDANIARRLRETAERYSQQRGVVFPHRRMAGGRIAYQHVTFEQLDRESDRLARGLVEMGVEPGTRLVLMVRPSLEFIALTFAMFKAGAVVVLIDPGMGPKNIFRCLDVVEPQGFVAISVVHAIRTLHLGRFPLARFNVTVGRRWFWGGTTYRDLLGGEWTPFEMPPTKASDPAAIIFTSGSTGPPKGVLYEHGMFDAQVEMLRDFYGVEPGEVDLAGFPLFALFNAAMGVTTVIPVMDPSRPARVDPARIVEAVHDHGVTQAFGSPAMWNRVGRYCEERGIRFPSLKRVLSAGAPVPPHVLERMRKTFVADSLRESNCTRGASAPQSGEADIHTPYGATESLPVASISGREVLEETMHRTREGAGVCVGRLFPGVEVKIVEITDGPISSIHAPSPPAPLPEREGSVRELPPGEIGEIVVRSPSTTREYFAAPEATAMAKVSAPGAHAYGSPGFWHRMGDAGYFDEQGRLWFCGRKAHIVETESGRLFSVCCEAIFNEHPRVYRTALVGVRGRVFNFSILQQSNESPPEGDHRIDKLKTRPQPDLPVIVVEPEEGAFPEDGTDRRRFEQELRRLAAASPLTRGIERFLFHPSLPVDVRHNVKINREQLAEWAARQLHHLQEPVHMMTS